MPIGAFLVLALALSLIGTLFNLSGSTALAAPARPNIVMFYIDDFSPYPDRLWDNARRTPELARFANYGLEFENAHASTPLCGPARANLLTGKYGHQTGVTRNKLNITTMGRTVASRLRNHGYRTAFIGKHQNGLADAYPSRGHMATLSRKWDQFDVIWHNQGRFYGWRQYRKSGTRSYGHKASDHSSYQAAMRAVRAVESTPKHKPLFMIVSLYDGHDPLTPLRRFENHPKCRDIRGWQGPSYNERDVSDKPAYIRASRLRGRTAMDLRDRCEEAMTVDWVIGQVRRALKQSGRARDTLQIFTSDHGYLLGDHRLLGKPYPYSTHVPLYMRWPARLSGGKRVIAEPVSNIDFGTTFCVLAGCSVPGSDGRSLLPLILDRKDRLGRRFIYLEMLHAGPHFGDRASAYPGWVGIQSTRVYSDRLWSYTRYQTGEEELYDLNADPYKLENLAGQPGRAGVLSDMRRFWRLIRDRDTVRFRGKSPG